MYRRASVFGCAVASECYAGPVTKSLGVVRKQDSTCGRCGAVHRGTRRVQMCPPCREASDAEGRERARIKKAERRKDPAYNERERERMRERRKDPDWRRERNRKAREYNARLPRHKKLADARRRDRLSASVTMEVTEAWIGEMLKWQGGICAAPGCDAQATGRDHDTPLSRGGLDSVRNCRSMLCLSCNLSKGNKTSEERWGAPIVCAVPVEIIRRYQREGAERRAVMLAKLKAEHESFADPCTAEPVFSD